MQSSETELITRRGIVTRYVVGLSSIYLLQRIHRKAFPPVRGMLGRSPAFNHAEILAFFEEYAPQYLAERQPGQEAAV